MKAKKIHIYLALIMTLVLTACGSGGGGGGASSTAGGSTILPVSSSQFANVPENGLLTYQGCEVESGSNSVKYYFTRLPSNQILLEKDTFMAVTDCSANLHSTAQLTYQVLGFTALAADPTFDELSLSLVSSQITFYNQTDVNTWNSAGLFSYTDWAVGVAKRIDCRKPDPQQPAQEECAGTASTEKLRYVSPNLNYGNYLFQ